MKRQEIDLWQAIRVAIGGNSKVSHGRIVVHYLVFEKVAGRSRQRRVMMQSRRLGENSIVRHLFNAKSSE